MFDPKVNTDPQLGVTPTPSEFTCPPNYPLTSCTQYLAMGGGGNKYYITYSEMMEPPPSMSWKDILLFHRRG